MKLLKTLYFNHTNLKIEGFVDLGQYTSEEQKKKERDHALVLMFQPFKHGFNLSSSLLLGCREHKYINFAQNYYGMHYSNKKIWN